MTNNYEELIALFEQKVKKVISEYESLKLKNEQLQQDLSRKQEELMLAHKNLLDLQNDYTYLRMARYLNVSPKEQKISKQYMNGLVREIDKCLALLDE